MPYIKPEDRRSIYARLRGPQTAGELNFAITDLIIKYLKNQGLSYQTCNDIVGVLDNASHEFKRRVQDPYEDKKIRENGDVYPIEFLGLK